MLIFFVVTFVVVDDADDVAASNDVDALAFNDDHATSALACAPEADSIGFIVH